MSDCEAIVILCTAPDEATAQELAARVLGEKLAACATLLPGQHRCITGKGNCNRNTKCRCCLKAIASINKRYSPT